MNQLDFIRKRKRLHYGWLALCWVFGHTYLMSQNTVIKGFVETRMTLAKEKVSFSFGEQDLFIFSNLSDRISFLGETVFKYDSFSQTDFSVSVERIIVKYNINGNHNFLIGKHHTPVNYWNDTYHHGVLFFPTIDRPLLFPAGIIPFHTTGISFQGHDLGKLKFGYDLMIGNGIGSPENGFIDNDRRKSVTIAMHVKPAKGLRIGASYYNDVISEGADVHEKEIYTTVRQQLYTGSIAYFGKKFELLAESTFAANTTDSTGVKHTVGAYAYGGYRLAEKYTLYFRLDDLHFQDGELYFIKDNTTSAIAGMRYQINYLTVVKLEYQHLHSELHGILDRLTAQVAVGF